MSKRVRSRLALAGAVLILSIAALPALAWAALAGTGQPASGGFFGHLMKAYTPRRVCMAEETPVVWLHLVSDAMITVAYFSIPVALVYFLRRRKGMRFGWVAWMFAAFILACGTTHLFGIIDLWRPFYRLEGIVKLATGLVSLATAAALWPLMPAALALPDRETLEQRVRTRTAELEETNRSLLSEVARREQAEDEVKSVRERVEAIIASAMDAVITVDEEQRVTLFNSAAEAMFRCKAEDALGQSLDRFIPPQLRQCHREHIRQFGQTGTTNRSMGAAQRPLTAVRCDNEVFPIEAAISQTRVGGRRFYTAIIRDVTERKQAEEEREFLLSSERAARAEAERATRTKDEFLATVSHELRTPLNAILGWSTLLARRQNDPDVSRGLEVIQRSTRAQAQLVEDLLDMSRIVSGKMRLDMQPLDLVGVIEAAVRSVEPSAEAKQIRIQRMLDPAAGAVTCDPARLQQVMWNLLTNAIKFTPRGGRVSVILERVNSHVEVAVSDTGEGIDPVVLPLLFERFRQADSSTTRKYGGLGLGLGIVRHLVELHGGHVRAYSEGRGQGATFTIHLPLRSIVEPGATDRHHPSTPLSVGERHDISLQGIRVLAVDDDIDTRVLLKRVLEESGAEVATADSASEGLQELERHRPHIVLCDIGMPGEDGYSFVKRMRRLEVGQLSSVPAVALTAFSRPEDRRRALLAGFNMHLAKPVDPAEVTIVVANLARPRGG